MIVFDIQGAIVDLIVFYALGAAALVGVLGFLIER